MSGSLHGHRAATRPPHPVPPPRRHLPGTVRTPALDGVRGLAVLAVLTYHFEPSLLPGGFVGVDVFFVLSGFLVSRALVREVLLTGQLRILAFWRRRAQRLVPALAALLVVVCAGSWVWPDTRVDLVPAVVSAAAFVHNWWLVLAHHSYFETTGRPSPLQHLWSLGVEGQFYLLWPPVLVVVLLPAAWRRPDRRVRPGRAVSTALLAGTASAAALAGFAVRDGVPFVDDGSRLYYSSLTHATAIAFGSALGCRSARSATSESGRPEPCPPRRALSSVVGVLALLALTGFAVRGTAYSPWTYRVGFFVVAVLATAVVHAAARPGPALTRLLGAPPLRWLGVRSYSLYLWHWPVTVVTRSGTDVQLPTAVDFALRVVLTLALGLASHRWLEDPVRHRALTRRLLARTGNGALPARERTVTRITAGALVLLLAAAGAAVVANLAAATQSAPRTGPAPGPTATAGDTPTRSPADPGAAPGPAAVSVYGDSVLLGARAALERAFTGGVRVDAVVGRQPAEILSDLRADLQADVRADERAGPDHDRPGARQVAPLVVLQVGNNGAVDPDTLTSVVRAVAAEHRVLLMTVGVDRAWRAEVNRSVLATAHEVPGVTVVRWDQMAADHPSWLAPDGLHLRPSGARGLALQLRQAGADPGTGAATPSRASPG